MRSLEEKLSEVEKLFNRGSKSFQAAVEVVRKGRALTKDERGIIAGKIGCSPKTVDYTLTKLRKAGLYGSTDEYLTPQEPEETKEDPKKVGGENGPPKELKEPKPKEVEEVEEPEEPEGKYVTVEHFNRFVGELKAVMGITPIQEPEPDDYVEEQYEAPMPESVDLEKATMKQYGTWIKSQNQLLFDFARQGAFDGALEDFRGNWSDFVNLCLEDYFSVVHNVGIGLLSRRFAR